MREEKQQKQRTMHFTIHTDTIWLTRDHFRPAYLSYIIFEGDNLSEELIIAKNVKRSNNTTNNRMQIRSGIAALDELLFILTRDGHDPSEVSVEIISDAQYLVNGYNTWSIEWEKKDWRKVKNVDLWKELKNIGQFFYDVRFTWVKSGKGDKWNDYAENLCDQEAIKRGDSIENKITFNKKAVS